MPHLFSPPSLFILQPLVAFSTIFSQKLKMIWESKGNEAVDVQLTLEEGIDWMSNKLDNCSLSSSSSCTPVSHAASLGLGVACVLFRGATAHKSGRNLHASLTQTPMSLRRKVLVVDAWAGWIIDLVADSCSRLTQSPNWSAALLKSNYCTTRRTKCFPKLWIYSTCLSAQGHQKQNTSTNKLTGMFKVHQSGFLPSQLPADSTVSSGKSVRGGPLCSSLHFFLLRKCPILLNLPAVAPWFLLKWTLTCVAATLSSEGWLVPWMFHLAVNNSNVTFWRSIFKKGTWTWNLWDPVIVLQSNLLHHSILLSSLYHISTFIALLLQEILPAWNH